MPIFSLTKAQSVSVSSAVSSVNLLLVFLEDELSVELLGRSNQVLISLVSQIKLDGAIAYVLRCPFFI